MMMMMLMLIIIHTFQTSVTKTRKVIANNYINNNIFCKLLTSLVIIMSSVYQIKMTG